MNKVLATMKEIVDRLNNDPEYLEDFMARYELSLIQHENQLICSVIDAKHYVTGTGDLMAYGLDHDYWSKLQEDAVNLFYQFHGQGD